MKKIKLMVFILLVISFMIVLFWGIFGTQLSYLSLEEIKENRKLNNDLITELKINNVKSIYDKNINTFYYNVPIDYENNNLILKLELDSGYRYKIINKNLNVIKVNYNTPIDIIIYNDEYYFETKIQLTNLPIINIKTENSINFDDTNVVFTYINASYTEKSLISNAKIHIRGSSSRYLEKTPYKINIYDDNYDNEKEIKISNFYHGNSFILDSLYKDPSKIRNLLATELWNDISNDFTNVDINSEFVELFINNEYKGLYILTEPINRSKLNLNKSTSKDTSIIIKAQHWNSLNSNLIFSNITSNIYLEYELKYPNDENLYSKSWEKVLSNLSKYYDNDVESTYKTISSVFNIQNYIDMIIFNAFINNSDNKLDKNNYFYMKSLNSNEIFIQPWDMEYSMGLLYSEKEERFTLKKLDDYDQIYTQFYHKDSNEINKLLFDRYFELRKSILTKEYFDNLLNNYKIELTKGASKRDSNLWYEYDIEKEIEEIRKWLYNRIDYFDEYVRKLGNE